MVMSLETARHALIRDGVPHKTADLFLKWFRTRIEVWKAFEQFALRAAEKRKRIGAKMIMERVRWEVSIEYNSKFKIGNSYTAYYARMFEIKYPQFKGLFETRKIKGINEQ